MPEDAFDDRYQNGVRISRTLRTISDAEIQRRDELNDASTRLAAIAPTLRIWAGDAQDVTTLTAMTAAQRLTRQAVIETRVAALARLCLALARLAGQGD
jgi:hypothetical protein